MLVLNLPKTRILRGRNLIAKAAVIIVLVILILIFSFMLQEKWISLKFSKFGAQRKSARRTMLLLTSLEEPEAALIGSYLHDHVDSMYLPDIFSMFEGNCSSQLDEKMKLFKLALNCDFEQLEKLLLKKRGWIDKNYWNCSWSTNSTNCTFNPFNGIFKRYFLNCLQLTPKNIEIKLKSPSSFLLSKLCRKSSLIIMHTALQCGMVLVREKLVLDAGAILKLLHVEKDPRARVSALMENYSPSNQGSKSSVDDLKQVAMTVCNQSLHRCRTLDELVKQSSTDMHMRIRAEEFEASKNLTMDRIFSFVGRVDPTEIRCWLSTYGNLDREASRKLYSRITWTWRKQLSISKVKVIQSQCMEALKQLFYVPVFYEEDLTDFKHIELFE